MDIEGIIYLGKSGEVASVEGIADQKLLENIIRHFKNNCFVIGWKGEVYDINYIQDKSKIIVTKSNRKQRIFMDRR